MFKMVSPPRSKNVSIFQQVDEHAKLMLLEKAEPSVMQMDGRVSLNDITKALDEYSRLFKAGFASHAETLTLARAYPDDPTFRKAASSVDPDTVMVVGGPASVTMIDREGHLITTGALTKAFDNYMDNFRTRNAMVLHSDVQVGWALPAYISKGGQIYKSGVNDKGLFFITEVRNDTKISDKVKEQIQEGKLKSYSIAGSATKVQTMQKGLMPYMQVDEMELAEVTVCEKGVNQGANFDILKAEQTEQTGKISKDQCGFRDATPAEIGMGIHCGTCIHFNKQDSSCDVVVGDIKADEYCDIYKPENDSPDTMDTTDEEEGGIRVEIHLAEDGLPDFTQTFLGLMKTHPGAYGRQLYKPREEASPKMEQFLQHQNGDGDELTEEEMEDLMNVSQNDPGWKPKVKPIPYEEIPEANRPDIDAFQDAFDEDEQSKLGKFLENQSGQAHTDPSEWGRRQATANEKLAPSIQQSRNQEIQDVLNRGYDSTLGESQQRIDIDNWKKRQIQPPWQPQKKQGPLGDPHKRDVETGNVPELMNYMEASNEYN